MVFEAADDEAAPSLKQSSAPPAAAKTFAFDEEEEEEEKTPNRKGSGAKTPKSSKPKTPRTPKGRVSAELVSGSGTTVSVRLHHHIDKYIKSASGSGPRGYRIEAFNKMFGDDLKGFGIAEEWRLTRIGTKDVDKCFYQMTKTNLDVEFRNNQNKGYEVTFAAPE